MKKIKFKASNLSIATVVIGLLIFLHWLGALNWADNIIAQVLSPLNNSFNQFSSDVNQKYKDTNTQRNSAEIIRQKDEQIAKLLTSTAELTAIKNDDATLKSYFKLFEDNKYDYVMTNVVARDIISRDAVNRNHLIINRGSKDGLRIGLIVVNQAGSAIGKISRIKDHLSEVSLLNSDDCQIAVTIQNETQTIGLAQGDLGLTIRLDFVPQSQKLNIGQLIVTSGLEPNIPANIVVGKIKSIDQSNINNIWQKVSLEPLADLDNLRWLAVILPKGLYIFD